MLIILIYLSTAIGTSIGQIHQSTTEHNRQIDIQTPIQAFTACIQEQPQLINQSYPEKYNSLKSGYKARKDRLPAGIYLPRDEIQVVKAINCARSVGIQPVPRSGGHSYENFSSQDDAVIIDLSDMAEIKVISKGGISNGGMDFQNTADTGLATVQGGARLGNVYLALANHDYNFNAGTCPSVGVGGHITGGGFGMLGRLKGLAADQVFKMRIVLYDGRVVVASPLENSDLFWAMRGGNSGSFGIVTEFTINIFKTPQVTLFRFRFGISKFPELVSKYMNGFTGNVEPRISSQLDVYKDETQLQGQFTGPKADLVKFLDFTGITTIEGALKAEMYDNCSLAGIKAFLAGTNKTCDDPDGISTPHQLAPNQKNYDKNKSEFGDKLLSDKGINTVYEHMKRVPNGGWLQFEALGGAVADYSVSDTPYYNRKALFSIQYAVPLQKGESRESENWKWILDLERALKPYTNGYHYQNYPDLDIGPGYGQAYFGTENFERLKQIKAIYDPTNTFRNEQSIPLP